jgi:hypothetical protein
MSCGGIATECSGNGRCLNLRDLAPLIKVKGELAGFSYGEDPNDSNTWERQKIRACLCDPGFFGYDCSLRECPRGDDPNTLNDAIEVQLIQCIANGGIFQLSFRDEITGDIAFNANDASIKAALEALETIGTVQVTLFNGMTACSTTGNTLIAVEFSTELGDLPSLKGYTDYLKDNVNGNGADGTGKLQMATGGAMLGGKTSIKGTRENIFCSNHGKCDYSTGQCICDPQFGSSNGKGGLGPIGDCGYQFVKGVQAAED